MISVERLTNVDHAQDKTPELENKAEELVHSGKGTDR